MKQIKTDQVEMAKNAPKKDSFLTTLYACRTAHKTKQRLAEDFPQSHPAFITCSFFYSGKLPMAGTAGTLAALPFAWLILYMGGTLALFIATLLVTLVGTLTTEWFEKKTKWHDASVVVIDEVAGIFLTCLLLPATGDGVWIYWLSAFILFRIFDWTKPWPACFFDKKMKGGFSVMMDDIVAGAYAFFVLYFIFFI